MAKLGILLTFMLLLGSLNAWFIMPNYKMYANVTVQSWTGNFPTNAICCKTFNNSYVLINTGFNKTLANSSISFLTISGYNSTGQFLGNISAFPYPVGSNILIANATQNGHSYNFLTIWFNQITQQPTYLNSFLGRSIYKVNTNSTIVPAIYIFNTTGIKYNPSTFLSSTFTANNGLFGIFQRTNIYFNLANIVIPNIVQTFGSYQILEQTPLGCNCYINYSLRVIPQNFGSGSYNLTQTNSTLNLIEYGTLGFQNVLNTNSTNPLVFTFPSTTGTYPNNALLSRGVGVDSSGNIFNSVITKQLLFGIFIQPVILGNFWQYQFTTLTNINRPVIYYFIPSSTSNYIITNAFIQNPIPINNTNNSNLDNQNGWFFDYNYRRLNIVKDWNFSYVTNAFVVNDVDSPHLGTYIKNNVGFLLYNTTHYYPSRFDSGMGNNCENIVFATNISNVYHQIPFGIVNCTNSNIASLVISNRTVDGFTFNNFYIYWGSRSGNFGNYNTQGLVTSWSKTYLGANVVHYADPNALLISLNTTLNPSSYINLGTTLSYNGLVNGFTNLNVAGDPFGGYNAIPTFAYVMQTQIPSKTATKYMYTNVSNVGMGNFHYLSANISIIGHATIGQGTAGITFNWTNNIKGIVRKLYTVDYLAQGIDFFVSQGSGNSTRPITPVSSNAIPISNSSLTNLNVNNTLLSLKLTGNVSIYGLNLPVFYIMILAIIGIIAFVSMIEQHTEQAGIFGLLFLFLLGIYQTGFFLLAILVILLYFSIRYTRKNDITEDKGISNGKYS